MTKTIETLTPAAIAGLTKPATIWRTMAQASNKAAMDIFTFHAPTLAQAYTSVKQLENALNAVKASYGLNKIFKAVLKACKATEASTVNDVFETALAELLTPKEKKSSPTKPATDVTDILGAIGSLTDTAALAMLQTAINERMAHVTAKPATPAESPALV